MAFDRFLIAPINSGWQTDLKPYLIPDDAFQALNNAYVFRGRVVKRFGSLLTGGDQRTSRLRVNVGVIAAGNLAGTVPGDQFNIGQRFTAGSQIFTVITAGVAQPMLATGPGAGTFSTTNGAFSITGTGLANGTIVYWYPGLPVMGIETYQQGPIDNQPTIAFDTRFAYVYTPGVGWDRSGTGVTPQWNGTDTNFFWTTTWTGVETDQQVLFVTNFNATVGAPGANDDPIWSYNSAAVPQWVQFSPYTILRSDGSFIQTARIVVAFKNRLVFLNTIERNNTTGQNEAFQFRARYSIVGSPFAQTTVGGASASFAWLEANQTYTVVVGPDTAVGKASGAGYIDAATEEAIISADFINDRLIVYFERSTWELAYTGNDANPFVWQKINTELGSESQNSTVPFDKAVLTIGNTGIHACNGYNVERIDQKIPDQIFTLLNANVDTQRIAGIRDYYNEMVYWAFPVVGQPTTSAYPSKIFVYNYQNGSWALNDDCFTVFGYFEQQSDTTWASATFTWAETNNTWNSSVEAAQFRSILAGTPEGFVLQLSDDQSRNAPSIQITNLTASGSSALVVAINHNLAVGDWVAVENCVGYTSLNENVSDTFYEVLSVINSDTILLGLPLGTPAVTGYLGGGTLARVSNIQIQTKQWNPYVDKSRNMFLHKIDFAVQKTEEGAITVDYYPSSTNLSMLQSSALTAGDPLMGTGVLETFPYSAYYPLEVFQEQLWHPVYFQVDGTSIQLNMYFTTAYDIPNRGDVPQISRPEIAWADFEMMGLVLYTQATTSRLQ